MIRALLLIAGSFAFIIGCSGEDSATPDGGAPDASASDAAVGDGAPEVGEGGASDADGGANESKVCPTASALVEALRGRTRQQDERSRALDDREHSLEQLEKAIDTRLANLEKASDLATVEVERLADIRAGKCREEEQICTQKIAKMRQEYEELEQGLASWDDAQKQQSNETRDAEVTRLTKALTTMRPEKAAATLSALDSDTAALLLSQIPERSSGKILAALDPSKTANIVQTLLAKSAPSTRSELSELARNTKTATKTETTSEADAPEKGDSQ